MTTRAEHLADIKTRLGTVEGLPPLYVSRVKTLDTSQLPAICLYAPDESSGEVQARGAAPQYRPTFQIAVEVRVKEADGFDVFAGQVAEKIKQRLFTDPDWLGRFDRYPTWHVHQYLDHRGEQAYCGEILTISARDRLPTEFLPVAQPLEAVTATAKVGDDTFPATISRG